MIEKPVTINFQEGKKLLDLYENLKVKKIKITFGEFIFDTSNFKLQKKDKSIYLTEGENNLLVKLINKRNNIIFFSSFFIFLIL